MNRARNASDNRLRFPPGRHLQSQVSRRNPMFVHAGDGQTVSHEMPRLGETSAFFPPSQISIPAPKSFPVPFSCGAQRLPNCLFVSEDRYRRRRHSSSRRVVIRKGKPCPHQHDARHWTAWSPRQHSIAPLSAVKARMAFSSSADDMVSFVASADIETADLLFRKCWLQSSTGEARRRFRSSRAPSSSRVPAKEAKIAASLLSANTFLAFQKDH